MGLSSGTRVVADSVNPQSFYACDPRSGKFYSSTNGAASFPAVSTVLPAQESSGFGFGGGATVTATPGIEMTCGSRMGEHAIYFGIRA